jgi:hypothetical protein
LIFDIVDKSQAELCRMWWTAVVARAPNRAKKRCNASYVKFVLSFVQDTRSGRGPRGHGDAGTWALLSAAPRESTGRRWTWRPSLRSQMADFRDRASGSSLLIPDPCHLTSGPRAAKLPMAPLDMGSIDHFCGWWSADQRSSPHIEAATLSQPPAFSPRWRPCPRWTWGPSH